MKTTLKSILLVAAILASSAFAQTEESGHEPGWYIQPVVGQFTYEGFCEGDVVDGISFVFSECEDNTIGFGLQGGYEVNEFWSVEGGFQLADFDTDITAIRGGQSVSGTAEESLDFVNLGMRGKIPFNENFFILGKGGFSFWAQEIDISFPGVSGNLEDDGTNFYYGVGVGVSSGQLGITIEYTFYNAADDLSFISVSGIYKF